LSKSEMHDLAQKQTKKLDRIANQKTLLDISLQTNFELKELHELRATFSEAIDRKQQMISKKRLRELLEHHLEGLNSSLIMEKLCDVFDENGDGKIDFTEFTTGLARVAKCTTEDKLDFLFRIYDVDNDGTMDVMELANMMASSKDDLAQVMAFTKDIVNDLDVDGDGKLDSPEFVGAVLHEPIMLQCFMQTLPVTPPSCYGYSKQLMEMESNDLSYEALQTMFLARLRKAAEKGKVDVTAFIMLMGDFCGCYDAEKPLLEDMFKKLEPEDGMLTPSQIYCALMRPLCGNDKQKAALVYQVMNVDGDSHVTREEINDYLKEHQAGLGKRATHILSVFESLDQDGSGSVNIDEAKNAVQKDADIADFFDMLLQLTI